MNPRERLSRVRSAVRIAAFPRLAHLRNPRFSPAARVRDPRYVSIAGDAAVGAHADLWAFCDAPTGGPGIVLRPDADIRSHALLHAYGGRIEVGTYSCVNHFCFINGAGGVTIGDDVMIGTGTAILSSEHGVELGPVPMTRQKCSDAPVVIASNVYIGANVTIQAGVTIGSGAVVASGAVVRSDVEPGDVVGGVPARVVKTRADRQVFVA